MKFEIFFLVKGPARTMRAPNKINPVEYVNLAGLMAYLAENLPDNESLGITTIGIEIKPVEE